MPATPPDTTESYDVFISYSHADADWVWDWLVPRLKAEGLAVCTDQESFDPGVPSLINMENAVAASRHTLLVLTPAYVQSQWTLYEQILTQTQDPSGLRQRTLPVLRQPCELPTRIATLTYVNLGEGAAVEREFGRLVSAIRGVRRLPNPPPVSVGGPMVATTSVVPVAPAPTFDTAVVRELLMAAFNDSELTTLCFDYFRPAHEQFAEGMNRTQKTQILVEHCERRGRMGELLSRVERANPHQYGQFKDRLRRSEREPGSKPLPPNPFAGVSSTHFVGREAELKRLHELLHAGSVTLVGEPKIGKSSLLRKLASIWKGPVIGPISLQELEDRDDLYTCIAEALGLKDHNWRAIREVLKSREVLLLLDELDAAPARGITIDDLSRFRAVAAANPKFRMVTDSHRPLKEVFPRTGPDSPGYSFLQPFTIGLLTEADARCLLTHPWEPGAPQFDSATTDQLLKLAGCHPFKLQRIAFHRYTALADPSYNWCAAYEQDLEQML